MLFGGGADVDQVFVGEAGVFEIGDRPGRPEAALAGLGLERVDVADPVQPGRGDVGDIARHDADSHGRWVATAELIVDAGVHRRWRPVCFDV